MTSLFSPSSLRYLRRLHERPNPMKWFLTHQELEALAGQSLTLYDGD